MTGLVIFCGDCKRPVEGVVLNPALDRVRGYWPFADIHERRHGHYPDNAYAGTVRPAVILATGRKEG